MLAAMGAACALECVRAFPAGWNESIGPPALDVLAGCENRRSKLRISRLPRLSGLPLSGCGFAVDATGMIAATGTMRFSYFVLTWQDWHFTLQVAGDVGGEQS